VAEGGDSGDAANDLSVKEVAMVTRSAKVRGVVVSLCLVASGKVSGTVMVCLDVAAGKVC